MADHPILKVDGTVVFAGAQAFRDHFKAFLSRGAVMVSPERALKAFEQLPLVLQVPGAQPVSLKAEVTSLVGSDALLRFVPFDAELQVALSQANNAALDPPAADPRAAAEKKKALSASSAGFRVPSLALKQTGTFLNPKLPSDFLALPITRPPTEAELAKPAMVSIVMSLLARKSEMLAVRVRSGSRDVEATVIQGVEIATPLPLEATIKTMAEPEGTYEITPVPVEPRLRYHTAASTFGLTLLKEYTKHYVEPEYAGAMSGRHGQSPKMTARGKEVIRTIGLSEVQLRIAHRMLTGSYALDDVLHNGVGVRSCWQSIFLLQVLGGLEWSDPPPRQNILVDELQATLARIKGQDHFSALGLHLSSSPQTIERTFARLRTQYGPGSPAHALAPQTADAIWAYMEKCYESIRTPQARKAYRATACTNVRLDYAAALVYDQARLAAMRKEWAFALDLMSAVLELAPSREYLEEFKRMQTNSKA